jgi:hypothetical protein
MEQHVFFLLRPNGILLCNVHSLYYSDENSSSFHVFTYIELYVYFCIFNILFNVFEIRNN